MTNVNKLISEKPGPYWEPNFVAGLLAPLANTTEQTEPKRHIDARHQIVRSLSIQRLARKGLSWDKLAEI